MSPVHSASAASHSAGLANRRDRSQVSRIDTSERGGRVAVDIDPPIHAIVFALACLRRRRCISKPGGAQRTRGQTIHKNYAEGVVSPARLPRDTTPSA